MGLVKPYEQCATRLEQRGWHPPTRAFVDGLVEELEATGVEAIIHSAVSQDCQPLFPSKVFPNCHPEASVEAFAYLLDRLHAIGRPVLSWYSLNHSTSVVAAHPDWRMVPMPGEGLPAAPDPAHTPFVCINSPYREMLPAFCREIVRDAGFDGVWFDGSTFCLSGNSLPGCRCEFCRRLFRDEAGLALPERVDWESDAFRRWIGWRYERLMGFWRSLNDAILEAKPGATVCFNNYRRRRRNGAWETGIPLRRLGWDALMSGELDLQVFHGDFQMKMHRAYGCARGQDSWMALCDHWDMWTPDVETLPVEQAAVSCAAAGGVMWMGTGAPPALLRPVLAAAERAAAPLMPFVGGMPVEYAAIWASQQTQDFGRPGDSMEAWDGWHGANELCLQAHVQSSVVFDDHVAAGELAGRYPVLLAGNTSCVSLEQAAQIRRYVEEGGVLVAAAEFALRDEYGRPYAEPPLDDLLGLLARRPGAGTLTLEIGDADLKAACGPYASIRMPPTLAEPLDGVDLLAAGVPHGMGSWDNRERRGEPYPRHPGLWIARRGRGAVVYLAADLFAGHLRAPSTFLVKLFKAVVTRLAEPAVTLEAPMQVALNVRDLPDGTRVAHLHNAPGTIWRYATWMNSGELVPVRDLALAVRDRVVERAVSGLTDAPFEVAGGGRVVRVPEVARNEVVVMHLAREAARQPERSVQP